MAPKASAFLGRASTCSGLPTSNATIEPLPMVAGFLLCGIASAKPGLPFSCFHATKVS